LRVTVRQTGANTAALGARVYVQSGGRTVMQEVGASPSYLSQNEPTLHFGLGESTAIESLRIVWPNGREDRHEHLAVDREYMWTNATEPPQTIGP